MVWEREKEDGGMETVPTDYIKINRKDSKKCSQEEVKSDIMRQDFIAVPRHSFSMK
jgi:hypothetical protein